MIALLVVPNSEAKFMYFVMFFSFFAFHNDYAVLNFVDSFVLQAKVYLLSAWKQNLHSVPYSLPLSCLNYVDSSEISWAKVYIADKLSKRPP